jgi:Fe-Mn family superoxide dismutase
MAAVSKKDLISSIRRDLGMPKAECDKSSALQESYVTQAKSFNLSTELLSAKNKRSHQELFEKYVENLNTVSAKLDTVSRDDADLNSSDFRALKIDECYNLNASFLHAQFFENVSDVQSTIAMDTLPFLRLERDFGTFDAWQKDFIACALSARNGWAVTVYNSYLNRYVNVIVDLHSVNVPFASYPVVVLDCWEHAYYRDYLSDRKSYVYGMMKELNWDVIEARFKKAEKIAKVMAG